MITVTDDQFTRGWGRTGKADACREVFNRHGRRVGNGWEFRAAAFRRAIHEAGQVLGIIAAIEASAPEALALANDLRPICAACDRYRGDAGRLGVHCGCKGNRPCSNVVAFSGKCPDGKW